MGRESNAVHDCMDRHLLLSSICMPASCIVAVACHWSLGSWDQPAGCVRIHRTNPTKLQYLCLIMSEKAQTLVENNEKILDARGGPCACSHPAFSYVTRHAVSG